MKHIHWIKVQESSVGHHELLADFTDVLGDLGISVYRDENQEEVEGVDLFIRLEVSGLPDSILSKKHEKWLRKHEDKQ